MDNKNSKILLVSFVIAAVLTGFTAHLLIKAFAAAFGIVARFSDSDLVRHGLPVLIGVVVFGLLQFNPKVLAWADEVVVEIRKVVWPTRKDTTAMTIVVVIMVIVSSIIVTSFDLASGSILKLLMN
jgi:preprotein translocase subunit SecE